MIFPLITKVFPNVTHSCLPWSPSLPYGLWDLPILIRNNPVTLILTPHCPLTREIKHIFLILKIFIWYKTATLIFSPHCPQTRKVKHICLLNFRKYWLEQACNSNPYSSLSPDAREERYKIFIKFSKILARNKHVTLILTPHGPQRRKIQYIY